MPQPGKEIGDEVHANVDQFFRIERGDARFVFDAKEERLVHDGDGLVVPAGARHSVVNPTRDAVRTAADQQPTKTGAPQGPCVLDPGAAQNFIGMVVASPVIGSITEA